jgi:hypothetical protein
MKHNQSGQHVVDREFMRRLIRAYEEDLLKLKSKSDKYPGGDWADDDLKQLTKLRDASFSKFTQTIHF